MPANRELIDLTIQHAIYLERFKKAEVRKISDHLERRTIAETLDKLKSLQNRKTNFTNLLIEIKKGLASGLRDTETFLSSRLIELGVLESKWLKRAVSEVSRNLISFILPSPTTIYSAVHSKPFQGKILSGWFEDLSKRAQTRVVRTIRDGVLVGSPIPDLSKAVQDSLKITKNHAESVTRTAVSHVTNEARHATYEENEDIVEKWQFVATLDGRTTLICMANDGSIHPLGKGPRLPLHFGERSTSVPILKSWKELGLSFRPTKGQRASMDGTVSDKISYDEWLRTRSKEFQDEVLGSKKAEIFRSGVQLTSFIDSSGKSLSLSELTKLVNSK